MDSELSDGEDLQDDLQDALDHENFSFSGTFYHASVLTSTPNPCLHISGLGIIGLPLSERDAKSIISRANLAPFGHGERTVVDKSVRDTWEIEPARIVFANRHWNTYLKSVVIPDICKSLGVTIGKHPPKLEFYKLLLYEKGSHFLPHQDTQKANGMFATVIIILPSAYTGGEVVVSHGSTSKSIELAPDSLESSVLLAWYTDVKHEVKEITSGYRLALSYNLIHDAPAVPRPSLPDMDDAVTSLKHILQRWKEGKYEGDRRRNLIAYLLDHQYSTANLSTGAKSLKGVDAHRVQFLRPIAKELGLKLGLASLEHNVSGVADDWGNSYHRRRRYNHDDVSEDADEPIMSDILDSSTKILGLVDLRGRKLIPINEMYLSSEDLVPKEPFEEQDPDEKQYEGYTGNAAGQLEYWYRRTVLVIIPEDRLEDIYFSVQGAPYAFKKLEESSFPPTHSDRQWAHRLLESHKHQPSKEQIPLLMDYALKWIDLSIWKGIMKLRSCTLQVVGIEPLLRALDLFSFEAVRVNLEDILARSINSPDRLRLMLQIRSKVSTPRDNQSFDQWFQKELEKILSSYPVATANDVPGVLDIIRLAGFTTFLNIIMPKLLQKRGNYFFWISFYKTVRERRERILEEEARHYQNSDKATTDGQARRAEMLDRIIKDCLQATATRWMDSDAARFDGFRDPQTLQKSSNVDRIKELVAQAISISALEICRNFFNDIIDMKTYQKFPPSVKFEKIYQPLIPQLLKLLAKRQLAILTPPFLDFFQVMVGLYLKDILGVRFCRRPPLRRVGCGCDDCKMLDAFILNAANSQTTFWLAQGRRTHLQRRLDSARDICSHATIQRGSPHGLQVTKLPEVWESPSWPARQNAAKLFLSSIGPEPVIAQIMGQRFEDVQRAVEGVTPFASPKTTITFSSTTNAGSSQGPQLSGVNPSSATQQKSSGAPSITAPPVPNIRAAPPPVAGQKRKHVVQLGPVIDLTEDD